MNENIRYSLENQINSDKLKNNISISPKGPTSKISLFHSQNNNAQQLNPFYIKKINVNLDKNNNLINNKSSPKDNIQQKKKENIKMPKNVPVNGMKYLNQNKKNNQFLQEKSYQNQGNRKINNYVNLNLRTSNRINNTNNPIINKSFNPEKVPGLLRAWKSEFIEKAPVIFDAAREDTAREKLESERKKTASLEKMIGKLTMKVEFLKKKSSELLGPDYASQYGPCPFDE